MRAYSSNTGTFQITNRMVQEENPMTVLFRECPQVSAALDDLINAIRSLPVLDGKTRQLVNIGIQTATRNPRGVYFHAIMARNEGAAREEVIGAVVMNLHLAGLAAVLDCLGPAIEGYDEAIKKP
jgi:alkylhydroperoxidase/carboxymuconolactone decarboxylase family protein YurZ